MSVSCEINIFASIKDRNSGSSLLVVLPARCTQVILPVRFRDLYEAMVTDADIRAKIDALIAIKKEGKECDTLSVDKGLVEYARKLADYYNESVGSFRPEQNKVSTEALDAILYDMVNNNA